VHHLSPRVPSYRLRACVRAVPALRAGPRLSLGEALGTWRLALWDEAAGRLVPFAAARAPAQSRRP
jgi:omega-6 fatty acid desaturase (delta-12 desaturase)